MSLQTGKEVFDTLDGEHDATYTQCVHRCVQLSGGSCWLLELHQLKLAVAYSGFYQQCPVLLAGDDATRQARLRLCNLVRRVLADGLELLGIEAPTRM